MIELHNLTDDQILACVLGLFVAIGLICVCVEAVQRYRVPRLRRMAQYRKEPEGKCVVRNWRIPREAR